ncbi:MAG TPA: T9SS type A sorting domain-containing protein [Cyclobacteriaceae bacterium]|jgi:hypothetical protein|nr:T9SS type A sorting domain-containing protein [Cyclobacteriaceae bacterium]
MLRQLVFVFGWLIVSPVVAQLNYHFDQTIPVKVDGKNINLPWAGGLNSAQVNTIDLNRDGKEDLAIFDRTANKLFTYLSTGNGYTYNPEFEAFFPSVIDQWVLLRDFNCDGQKDLFTSNPAGISVFVNVTGNSNTPRWRPFNQGNPLLTIGFSGSINLQVNGTDIPAIDDVDEDGDLDIIVARFVGIGTMEFHKNLSIENVGRCDSMQLQRVTNEWGNFIECNCGKYVFGGTDCSQFGGRTLHDAGKSLLTLDLNNDGLRDLIFSEQNCSALYLIENGGTKDSADMKSFDLFPQGHPTTLLFPAAFYEDADFDGVKDLVVSTNISARVPSAIDLSNSVSLYKNTGTTVAPQFNLQKTNWLQDQMVDVGSYASPAFGDYDNDGDMDLFVSYWAGVDTTSSIFLYENTGSFSSASFELIDKDYLGISQLGLFNINIQFADINVDGKKDLVFTATDKKLFNSHLFFFANKSNQKFDFAGQPLVEINFSFNQFESILITDVNSDGLPDILIGKTDGSLQYWNNGGSGSSPHFGLFNSSYLGLGSNIIRYCPAPAIADINGDGKQDLLIGNKGTVVMYSNYRSGPKQADTLLFYNPIKDSYGRASLGNLLALATADLYGDGNHLIAAGMITGGIRMLKSDSLNTNSMENAVVVWPNPLQQGQGVSIRVSRNSEVQFFNVLGQKISDPVSILSGERTLLPQSLSSGFYFARVSWAGGSETVKLIVR